MGLIAALALFGASTAYSSFTQVISADELVAAHFAGSLRMAFASFMTCATATFFFQFLPPDHWSGAFGLILMGSDLLLLGMGFLLLALPLLTSPGEDSQWRVFGGVLVFFFCVPFAITSLAASISGVRAAELEDQREGDCTAARLPAGAADAAQAAAFLRTYDLYGGALAYLRRALPGGAKPDTADFSDVLEAFLPAGTVDYQNAGTCAAPGTGPRDFLRDAERWYAVADELRRRALHLHAAPPPLHERVRGLLLLEQVFLRRTLGKQTSRSERPASPTRMDEETPLSPPETPHIAIEVTGPDGRNQGSHPRRLDENLPPA